MNAPHPSPGCASRKDYSLGLLLSLILMAASLATVLSDALPHMLRLPAIGALCAAQLLVLLGYFLRLGSGPNQRDKTVVAHSTALLIILLTAGTLWAMPWVE
jgi:cytochrome o ubiquinol oxidase operon protein cyoD